MNTYAGDTVKKLVQEPENWPPNGPDLNYSIWGALQQLVDRQQV